MTTAQTTEAPARMFATCPRCKTAHAEDIDPRTVSEFWYLTSVQGGGHTPHRSCKNCGRGLYVWTKLAARYNEAKKCDGRCLNAKRADCECSCGGHNHGKGNL